MINSKKNSRINFIKGILSIVLAMAVFFTANAFMSVKTYASLPDKAGFAQSTDITLKDYTITVPSYWESDIYDATDYRAYVYDDAFTMLIISAMEGLEGVSFKDAAQRDLFIGGVMEGMGTDGDLKDSAYRTFGTNEGAYAVFDATISGIPFKGTLFAMIDNGMGYCFMLAESPDNKYDYQPDFFKTITSAKKGAATAAAAAPATADDTAGCNEGTKAAIEDAKKYLDLYGFSKKGLIVQLSSEYGSGYSVEDSTKAVEYLEKTLPIDWNEQAVKSAEAYQKVMSFDRAGMIQMLSSDTAGYTKEQAEYAADKLGLK